MKYRKIVQRIREEFEGPWSSVDGARSVTLLGLDEATCELVLSELAVDGFLARGSDKRFQVHVHV